MKLVTLVSIFLGINIIVSPVVASEANPQPQPVIEKNSSQEQTIVNPEVILRNAITAVTGQLKNGGKPEQLLAFFNKEIAPYFDFNYMARLAASYHWNSLDDKQQNDFVTLFQNNFFQALVGKISNLGSPNIQFYPARPGSNHNEVTVSAQVIQPQGMPVLMDFRFYRSDNGWKVFDVMADGSSAVLYYRRFYAELANRYGASALLGGSK